MDGSVESSPFKREQCNDCVQTRIEIQKPTRCILIIIIIITMRTDEKGGKRVLDPDARPSSRRKA